MNQYRAEINVTTKWFVDIPGETENAAECKVSLMDLDEIEASGDFGEVTDVEVVDIELACGEDDDEQ